MEVLFQMFEQDGGGGVRQLKICRHDLKSPCRACPCKPLSPCQFRLLAASLAKSRMFVPPILNLVKMQILAVSKVKFFTVKNTGYVKKWFFTDLQSEQQFHYWSRVSSKLCLQASSYSGLEHLLLFCKAGRLWWEVALEYNFLTRWKCLCTLTFIKWSSKPSQNAAYSKSVWLLRLLWTAHCFSSLKFIQNLEPKIKNDLLCVTFFIFWIFQFS